MKREDLRKILRGKCISDDSCEAAIDELLNLHSVSGRIPLGTKVKTVQGDKTITNNAEEFEGEPAYRCDWNTEELWITSDFIKVYDR